MSLFDAMPAEQFARVGDPDTAHAAAALGDSFGPLTQWVMRTLVEVERTSPMRRGVTPHELRMRMMYDAMEVPDTGSVCRRLTTLHRKGYVNDTGERRVGGKRRNQIAWTATPAGRAWLADTPKEPS